MARPYRQNAKVKFGSVCKCNDDIFYNHLVRRPANLREFMSGEIGTNTKTLMTMINEGPLNEEEIEILDYYIWNVAAPLLKSENLKMQTDTHHMLSEEEEEEVDD